MQIPSLRVAMPRLSFDWLEGFGVRRFFLYALYSFVVFAIFLVVNFPHDVIVQRVLREVDIGPVGISVASSRFAWHRGYELQRLQLTERSAPPDTPPFLQSSSVFIRPGLEGLLRGEVTSAYLDSSLYGGELHAAWSTQDGMNRVTLQLDGMQIHRYEYLTRLLQEGQIEGILSGAVTIESRNADVSSGRAAGKVEIARGALLKAKINDFGLPDLHFDDIVLEFTLQNNRLEIQELHADGEELKLKGEGQVVLRQPTGGSVLNLRVSIIPGPNSPEAIRGLLDLIPRPKGSRPDAPIVVSGTIDRPRFR
jgi:type II secretion system protein N